MSKRRAKGFKSLSDDSLAAVRGGNAGNALALLELGVGGVEKGLAVKKGLELSLIHI